MMGRTVGNSFLFFALITSSLMLGKVSLRVIDDENDQLQQVQVGRPFIVEVAISGKSQVDEAPEVQGIDQFQVEQTSWRYEMINSKTKVKYLYTLIAQSPGEFTLGPAVLNAKSNTPEQSNIIKLKVSEEEFKQGKEQSKEGAALLRLSVDKNHVVKGEKVKGTLRFYTTGPEKLRNFIEQESTDIRRKKAQGPKKGTEVINGTEYNFLEFSWDMYPVKSGAVIIPAFGAEYEQNLQRDHLWGGLGRLFGAFTESKRIYSNALTLQVDDIPESDKKIQGIGIFDSFTIKADPPMVKQGEGSVVSIELKGEFDPESVDFPGLHGVPKELRYYESKESSDDHGNFITKRFEYILQGLSTGNWQLPAQEFHYFDTASRSHKTLRTAPLSITILPGAPKAKEAQKNDGPPEEMLALTKQYYQPLGNLAFIPCWLFLLLCFFPIAVLIFKGVQAYRLAYRLKGSQERKSRQAVSLAQSLLQKIERKHEPQRIYTVFMGLFADKWQVPLSVLSDSFITERLKNIFDAEQLKEWQLFFSQAAELAYGGKKTDEQVEHLFTQAKQWLEILRQLL